MVLPFFTQLTQQLYKVQYHDFMQCRDVLIEMLINLLNINQRLIIYTNQEVKTLLANWKHMQHKIHHKSSSSQSRPSVRAPSQQILTTLVVLNWGPALMPSLKAVTAVNSEN